MAIMAVNGTFVAAQSNRVISPYRNPAEELRAEYQRIEQEKGRLAAVVQRIDSQFREYRRDYDAWSRQVDANLVAQAKARQPRPRQTIGLSVPGFGGLSSGNSLVVGGGVDQDAVNQAQAEALRLQREGYRLKARLAQLTSSIKYWQADVQAFNGRVAVYNYNRQVQAAQSPPAPKSSGTATLTFDDLAGKRR